MNDTGFLILFWKCKSNCVFCGMTSDAALDIVLPVDITYKKLLEDIERIKGQGLKKIQISGSDPIEYPRIIEIVKHIKKEGFEEVSIATHGRNLSDNKFAEELIVAGIDSFIVPVFGSNPKVHDEITQSPGSFDETIEGVKNAIKLGSKISISPLILRQNLDDLIPLYELVKSLNVESFSFSMTYLTKECDESYFVSSKELYHHLSFFFDYVSNYDFKVAFLEFPFCLFGKISLQKLVDSGLILNNMGKYEFLGDKNKDNNSSTHRKKVHVELCSKCKARDFCDGFFEKDVELFGTGSIEPFL